MDASNRNLDLYLRARNATVVTETQIKQPWPYTGGYWDEALGWTNDGTENSAVNCDIFAGITYSTLDVQLIPGGPVTTQTLSWPTRFQAVHMNLIPRGPNRGKVMAWCGNLVVGVLNGGWKNGQQWTFQPWCIVDPNSASPRHYNFLLPLAPREREGPASVTFSPGSATVTAVGHGFETGDSVCVSSSGAMPAPFTVDTNYVVNVLSSSTFQLLLNGAAVTATSAGSGTVRVTKDYFHTLFCAAQAWDHRGNLVVVGGARYMVSKGWSHSTYKHNWLWDPTVSADVCYTAGGANPYTGTYANMERVSLAKTGTPNHYSSQYGRWIQGPDLDQLRYYPAVAMTAPMGAGRATHPNKTIALVLGGNESPSDTDSVSDIPGTYEALVCDAAPTYTGSGPTSNSGLVKEQSGGVYSWDGPSDWDPITNPFPDGHPYKDGLYFYPHMHLLTDGRLFMSGFVPKSATLNHELAPGTWTTTEGHDDRPGLINAFRYYPTSVHWIDSSGADVVLRMGGGQIPVVPVPDRPVVLVSARTGNTLATATPGGNKFQTGEAVKISSTGTPPNPLSTTTTYFAIRISDAEVQLASSLANAIAGTPVTLTTDGTGTHRVYADLQSGLYGPQFPGYRPTAFPEMPLDTRSVDRIYPSTASAQWEVGPALNRPRSLMNVVFLADGGMLALGGVDIDESKVTEASPSIHPLLMSMTAPTMEEGGHTHVTVGLESGGFIFHLTPELMRWGGTRWEPLDWATSRSARDYHSTAVLLPDGRVMIGGGEGRSLDFEVFEPPYLRPSADYPDIAVTRPTNVTLSASGHAEADYSVSYATSYTLTCDALPEGQRIERVTLVAPGAVTHHQDWSQQFANLTVVAGATANSVTVTMPANNKRFRPGFAMLFAITSLGVPSVAKWVKLPHP